MKQYIPSDQDLEYLKQKLRFQFSLSDEELNQFLPAPLVFEISKKTDRLRYIYFNSQLWGMIRPNDGFFLLSSLSARQLAQISSPPNYRVIVQSEVGEFIRDGKNVFAKHVVDCDSHLVPYSEVIVVDEQDQPLAFGKLLLNKQEALAFTEGVAVKVRKGIR
ncbi:MAG: hypothetical protein EU536_03330 [Promethearchaeota archaeon]|nr:MAG: hypothetical protein EU536_03330 [Candidatus Lokiarchaeota archaeon]